MVRKAANDSHQSIKIFLPFQYLIMGEPAILSRTSQVSIYDSKYHRYINTKQYDCVCLKFRKHTLPSDAFFCEQYRSNRRNSEHPIKGSIFVSCGQSKKHALQQTRPLFFFFF